MPLDKDNLPETFGPIAESDLFEFSASYEQMMVKHKETGQFMILDWDAATELLATLLAIDDQLDFTDTSEATDPDQYQQ